MTPLCLELSFLKQLLLLFDILKRDDGEVVVPCGMVLMILADGILFMNQPHQHVQSY